MREKETGEKEGWLKMEEERDFQEGFSWEQLLSPDLPSSAQRPAPTLLVRMPNVHPFHVLVYLALIFFIALSDPV